MKSTTSTGLLWRTDAEHAVAQLRHLYVQLLRGEIKDQKACAEYLLAPAIRILEKVHTP